jgi:hypothetical protein
MKCHTFSLAPWMQISINGIGFAQRVTVDACVLL